MPEPPLLDMQNVRVMRGNNVVLDDFTLRVQAGEHVAILGPNGCGKSTLVKTITRECYPVFRECSSMTIFGRERWNVFELRSLLGIVSNDLMSFCTGEASGLDVVISGFFSSKTVLPHHAVEAEHCERALAALVQLNVPHLAERPVREMSSGEARRVLIARALVHAPRALLFDEPSNSLDIAAHQGLRQTMRSLADSGIGLILVTHDLSDIVPEIDRVLLMQSGKVIADGSKQEILRSGRLTSLFETKVEVTRRDGYYHLR